MSSKKLKTLIVGGAGFLGSHVADEMSNHGFDVTIYDLKKSEFHNPQHHFVQGHLLDYNKLVDVTKGFDYVYHFAAIADITEALEKRKEALEVNIMGSINLIEACIKNSVKTFIFASSVYVYSNKGSFYRVTKQAVENLLEEYGKALNFDYRILRYGSLYGPRAQDWNGLKKYVETILHTGKVSLRSEGLAKREYIHVTDAAKLSVEALNEQYRNQHLIITGTQSITAMELVTTIGEILDKKVTVEYLDDSNDSHYVLTPYKFVPKHGHKLTSSVFVDFGQGLLEVIEEVSNQKK